MDREKIRVLLIEDNRTAARLIERLLATATVAEYVLTTVERFADARERLVQHDWDVLLLDLLLPNGEGVELVRRVKELAAEVPVVIVTATDDEAIALRTIAAGAQDYLVKGQFDGPQLLRVIHRAIERNQAELRFRHIRHTLQRVDSTVAKLQQLSEGCNQQPPEQKPPV